jgi:hypothetical protein
MMSDADTKILELGVSSACTAQLWSMRGKEMHHANPPVSLTKVQFGVYPRRDR